MPVPNAQIGWTVKAKLLQRISKQLERLTQVASNLTTSTTTTSPSDIRLKTSIVLTGNKIGGLQEYKWEWNDIALSLKMGKYPTKGVLAQEALELYPKAVSIGKDGFYRVDYSKIKETK